MDPVNLNYAGKEELKKLPGCSKALASEIIKLRKSLRCYMTEDDMKAIPRLPATSWQQWLDKGIVTFDVSKGLRSSMEESELSTSGVSGQSASGEVEKGDGYKGPQQQNSIRSPARSVNRSPTGSIHSHHSSRSHQGSQVSSVSSVTRRQYEEQCIQYEEQIQKLKDELKEKNALLTERSDEN